MTILTEGARTAEFLQSLPNGYRGTDVVTIDTATEIEAGTVLALVSGDYVEIDGDSTVAAENTAVGILYNTVPAGYNGPATIVNTDSEVKLDKLIYTGDAADVVASLATLGIKARS
jgi:hypothetical protein